MSLNRIRRNRRSVVDCPQALHFSTSKRCTSRSAFTLDDNRQICHPPFFHQGPFWNLLRIGEETATFALSLIIRITNFATERWQDRHHQLSAKYPDHASEGPTCVKVPTADGWKAFSGDRNVLWWHDGWASQPHVLSSMLMAMEKWLYDEVDDGRSIDRWIQKILNEGRSAALVGVLVAVAKYKPELLRGPLQPLAGVWEIYAMEPRLQLERGYFALWPMDWQRYGEAAWNRARDWYTMPHRKTTLLSHVVPLILQEEAFRNEVFGFHQHWESLLQADEGNRHLCGPVNHFGVYTRYFRASAEGGEKIPDFYAWLAAQQREATAAQEQANEELLPLTLAAQCRKRIDENQPLKPDELTPFMDTLRRLTGLPVVPAEGGTQVVDAVFGGIAVLLLLHRDWLREDPHREQWCRSQLAGALSRPPGRQPFDFPDSVGDWEWDTFASECGVAILAENPLDPLARELVLLGLICFRYATVAATMRRAYRLRGSLGAEFDRMVRFVSDWSVLPWALRWCNQWQLDTRHLREGQCAPRLKVFVAGGDLPPARSLAEIDESGRQLATSLFAEFRKNVNSPSEGKLRRFAHWTRIPWLIDRVKTFISPKNAEPQPDTEEERGLIEADHENPTLYRGIPPTWPGLDLHYLMSGYAWLEIAAKEKQLSDAVAGMLRGLLDVSIRTVPKSDRKRRRTSSRFPTKFDQWLFERIGEALPRLPKDKAKALWQPVLALGVKREHWLKYFLSDCFRAAADKGVEPAVFVTIWCDLIRFAIDEQGWDSGWEFGSGVDDVILELLGFNMGKAVFGDNTRYTPLIAGMSPLFENAASRWFTFGKVAAGFCRFSLRPAGAELLVQGVRWLAEAEPGWTEWCWEHDGLAEALVDVLRTALDRHRAAIAASAESRTAFFHLCNQLVARGYPAALALRERIVAGQNKDN